MRRLFVIALLVFALGLFAAVAVSAEAITLTTYTDMLGDVTTGISNSLPSMATTVLAIGAGIFVIKLGWGLLHSFVR